MGGWLKWLAAGCVALTLTGCAQHDYRDLDEFKEQLKERPRPAVPPLPEFLPYQPFAYGASNLRNPFEPPQRVQPVDPARANSNVRPDRNRVKQYLEQFAIGHLAMVGTLAREGAFYALVSDPEGGVHRVSPGDYLGTDHGRVHAITETSIELVEIVSDGTGGWTERARSVALRDGN